jgi:ABC-type dipeptide/oligopeptide/nickel transport system permease component
VILASTVYIVINLVTDIAYGFIDPRVTASSRGGGDR